MVNLYKLSLYSSRKNVTDYRHCVETQDRHLEGSKIASTPPYILIEDQYCLQITVPISATYYPIMSYYLHLLRVYIEALEPHLIDRVLILDLPIDTFGLSTVF